MSACCNLYTFLWRRLYLQTVRRHYLALLIEIIFVLVTFIFFLQNDRVDLAQVKKLNSSSLVENVSRRRVNRSKVEFREICVVYGPSNDRTDKLINKLLKITGAGPYVVIPASHDEPHKEPVPMGRPRCGKPTPLEDASSVAAECRRTISILLQKYDYGAALERLLCIEFASHSTADISTGGLTYTLVLPVSPNFAFPREVLRSLHEVFENPIFLFSDDVTPVLRDNILQSLSLIDHVHMLLQGNHEDTTMLYSVDMPISAPVNDIGQYRNGFFVATTVGFCLPLVWRVRDVTAEIGSGLKVCA
ncbi:hypothetical protein MTO96_001825 [Rhipicephalus appendiculatus]